MTVKKIQELFPQLADVVPSGDLSVTGTSLFVAFDTEKNSPCILRVCADKVEACYESGSVATLGLL